MNLIIEADLINPPSEMFAFRDLTFFAAKYHPHYDVLIKCNKDVIDMYYRYLKNYSGSLDYVTDFIYNNEKGVYVTAERITLNTLPKILRQIGFQFSK